MINDSSRLAEKSEYARLTHSEVRASFGVSDKRRSHEGKCDLDFLVGRHPTTAHQSSVQCTRRSDLCKIRGGVSINYDLVAFPYFLRQSQRQRLTIVSFKHTDLP